MIAALQAVVLRLLELPGGLPPRPAAHTYAQVDVLRASPRWLQYRLLWVYLVGALLVLATVAICVGAVIAGEVFALVVALALALLAAAWWFIAWFAVRIEYELRVYVLTDRSLRVRQGAWTSKEMTLTYANVQNVQVLQGPVQRAFGIADVRVSTAGGGASSGGKHASADTGHSVTLAGLENAAVVRDQILDFVRRRELGTGIGDLDEARAVRTDSIWIDELGRVLDAATGLRLALERSPR